jgi:hypothetical protein
LGKHFFFYERAITSWIWFREAQEAVELADLYVEGAEVAITKAGRDLASEWCEKAQVIYEIHGIVDRTSHVLSQISEPGILVFDLD